MSTVSNRVFCLIKLKSEVNTLNLHAGENSTLLTLRTMGSSHLTQTGSENYPTLPRPSWILKPPSRFCSTVMVTSSHTMAEKYCSSVRLGYSLPKMDIAGLHLLFWWLPIFGRTKTWPGLHLCTSAHQLGEGEGSSPSLHVTCFTLPGPANNYSLTS